MTNNPNEPASATAHAVAGRVKVVTSTATVAATITPIAAPRGTLLYSAASRYDVLSPDHA